MRKKALAEDHAELMKVNAALNELVLLYGRMYLETSAALRIISPSCHVLDKESDDKFHAHCKRTNEIAAEIAAKSVALLESVT